MLFEHKITLAEALTGVNFVITHLDGSKIRIKNNPGEVIKPDDLKTVAEKGLPFHKQPYKFGNLFVMFKVTFPDSVPIDKVPFLIKALPSPSTSADTDMDAETVLLTHFDEAKRNTKAGGGQQDDSDEEKEDSQG